MECAKEQGKVRKGTSILIDSFSWDDTAEGVDFWNDINNGNFDVFYKKYPEKFKVGDRVRCTKNYRPVDSDMEGTIVDIRTYNPPIGIQWDGLTTGHECNGACPNDTGYYLPKENLTLISQVKEYDFEVVHCTTQEQWDFVLTKIPNTIGQSSECFSLYEDRSCLETISGSRGPIDWFKEKNSLIYSFKEWCDKFGHVFEEPKSQFEVGKWYKCQWSFLSDGDKTLYFKYKNDYDPYIKASRYMHSPSRFFDRNGTFRLSELSNIMEASIDEIQQYLPEGHPDKKYAPPLEISTGVFTGIMQKVAKSFDECESIPKLAVKRKKKPLNVGSMTFNVSSKLINKNKKS